jgi:putative ATP-dependent endonuclease of the OLD family
MRLREFRVKNFKNLEDVKFSWDQIVVLIGENNIGKSSVLGALQCFLSDKQVKDRSLLRDGVVGEDNAIELVGVFDQLTEWEKAQPGIRRKMHADQWILRKRFWLGEDEEGHPKCFEEYAVKTSAELLSEWPEGAVKKWADLPTRYQPLIEQVKLDVDSARVSTAALNRLKQLVRDRHPDWVSYAEPDFVPNEGGANSWKSYANRLLPQLITVEAVQEASDAVVAKESTAYGKILSLVVGKQLMERQDVKALQEQLDLLQQMIGLDSPDPNPHKLDEILAVEQRITHHLSQVIDAKAMISADPISLADILLPSTKLKLDDGFTSSVEHKGHGLQRTLIMALLQVLAEYQHVRVEGDATAHTRPVIFAVEEPELYMHPQMERKMRDALYALAATPNYQVICTTHSPVFLDMAEKHTAIVRLERQACGKVEAFQVLHDLFAGPEVEQQKKLLRMITEFDPAVNELFFAKRVVLVEGPTELAVFKKAAECMGIFEEHPHLRRDTTFVNCHGKWTIPLFIEVLNHFNVSYLVFHDEDRSKPQAAAANDRIGETVRDVDMRRMFSPENIESVLGYEAGTKDKPIRALEKLEQHFEEGTLPMEFAAHVRAAWGVVEEGVARTA